MKEDELKEIFLSEAMDGYEELNKHLIDLEKDYQNKKAIDAIFRITHTLKANAASMGYSDVAAMAHTFEDIFTEIKNDKITLNAILFNDLYKAIDIFGFQLKAIQSGSKEIVKYRGIKTKLEVIVRKSKFGENSIPDAFIEKSEISINKLPGKENINIELENKNIKLENIISNEITLNEELKNEPDSIQTNDSKVNFSDLVSIPIRKLDNLMNLVGELMIEKDRVVTVLSQHSNRNNEFSRLQRITSELQYSVMDVRLVQINVLFRKFNRIVRDTAKIENKNINLTLEGTDIEIDRNILQIISDSLIHIVRNAISHGIENATERTLAKKSDTGNIKISARSEKNKVIIEVEDDGKGINPVIIRKKAIEKKIAPKSIIELMKDEELIQLIFEPGFSSAENVTSVSGRGVGMDVVKKAIDSIGGKVEIVTEVGKGSVFKLILPSSMALKSALLFGLDNCEYAIPLSYTQAVIQLLKTDIHKVAKGLVANHLSKTISIVFLKDILNAKSLDELKTGDLYQNGFNKLENTKKINVIVVNYGNIEVGFVVDRLMQQKEIVEKQLLKPLDKTKFISGATILGTGNVCLVLDIPSIIGQVFKNTKNNI